MMRTTYGVVGGPEAQSGSDLMLILMRMGLLIVTIVALSAALSLSGCASAAGTGGGGAGGDSSGEGEGEGEGEPEPSEVVREIEEADIVKLQDGYFYLANRYRGLRIIDARTIERPEIVGGVDLTGRGVELYVDDDRAYVVTSADFFDCGGEPLSYDDAQLADALLEPDYTGSRITVADVSDPTAPFEISHFDMDGFIVATRRVGDVIYAAGNFDGTPSGQDEDAGTDGQTDDDDAGTDGPPDVGPPPPSSTGPAEIVDESGHAVAFVTSPGGTLAEFSVTGGFAGGFIQVTVADGNTMPSYAGIPDEAVLPVTVTVDGDLEEASFAAALVIEFDAALTEALGESIENLAIYRYDDEFPVWIAPATNRVGQSSPSGDVGDTGFYLEGDDDEVHGIWAVVDQLGDYAIGRVFSNELTLEIAGTSIGGTVVVEPPQAVYGYGDVVTLTAVPDEGFVFAGWEAVPVTANAPTADTLEIVMVENVVVTPIFEADVPVETGPTVFVVSIDISDPADIHIVDRVDVAGESLDIQVTQNAIYVLGDDPDLADTARVTYVDISDPGGDVVERDSFRVPGTIENRFFADEADDVFRIITEDRSANPFNPVVALYLYDVTNPDVVERVGNLTIETGESLRSVRFDGDRGYAVTFRQVDPLFVLDLSDPAEPVVAGQLQVPGWSTHLVPLGNRLVGVGFDDRAGFRPAVALYDVSVPTNPRQLARIVLGEAWTFDTTSEATVDEKALKVLEEEELILIPFSSYESDLGRYVDSLQLIDLLPANLVERGFIEHRGLVRRAGVLDTRLWVLSDEALQVADMDDRDDVLSLATEDIISEQQLLDAGLTDCADSARYHGFPIFDFGPPFFGDVFELPGPSGGPCGVITLVPFGLTAVGLAGFALIRPIRRRIDHKARD